MLYVSGYADHSISEPYREDTLTLMFSSTKGICALCVALLVDRYRSLWSLDEGKMSGITFMGKNWFRTHAKLTGMSNRGRGGSRSLVRRGLNGVLNPQGGPDPKNCSKYGFRP